MKYLLVFLFCFEVHALVTINCYRGESGEGHAWRDDDDQNHCDERHYKFPANPAPNDIREFYRQPTGDIRDDCMYNQMLRYYELEMAPQIRSRLTRLARLYGLRSLEFRLVRNVLNARSGQDGYSRHEGYFGQYSVALDAHTGGPGDIPKVHVNRFPVRIPNRSSRNRCIVPSRPEMEAVLDQLIDQRMNGALSDMPNPYDEPNVLNHSRDPNIAKERQMMELEEEINLLEQQSDTGHQ